MKRGFTLLELLVGITIFAIVAASVYTSLYLGIKVWKQEEGSDAGMQEAVLTLEAIAEQLRCTFINTEDEQITFNGGHDQINFFSVSINDDIENVVFYLERSQDTEAFSLYQSKRKYVHPDEEENSPRVALVNSNIESFALSYFDADEQKWYEDWPEELILPRQVKLEISFCRNGGGQPLQLVRYVNIPMANVIHFQEAEELL